MRTHRGGRRGPVSHGLCGRWDPCWFPRPPLSSSDVPTDRQHCFIEATSGPSPSRISDQLPSPPRVREQQPATTSNIFECSAPQTVLRLSNMWGQRIRAAHCAPQGLRRTTRTFSTCPAHRGQCTPAASPCMCTRLCTTTWMAFVRQSMCSRANRALRLRCGRAMKL